MPESIAFWQQRNGCTARASQPSANLRVLIERYSHCQAGAEVELATLKEAGHVFPRGGTGANALINGAEEIWSFFDRHPRSAQG